MDHNHAADSSRPKRTRKAATHPPSTSCSTTAGPLVGELIAEPRLLTTAEQQSLLARMQRGSSPQMACQQMGTDVTRFWTTLHQDRQFADAVEQAYETLTLNVVAVLYRAALEGDLAAQKLWLQHRPTLVWSRLLATHVVQPDYANMTNKELNALMRYERKLRQYRERLQEPHAQPAELPQEPRTQ